MRSGILHWLVCEVHSCGFGDGETCPPVCLGDARSEDGLFLIPMRLAAHDVVSLALVDATLKPPAGWRSVASMRLRVNEFAHSVA